MASRSQLAGIRDRRALADAAERRLALAVERAFRDLERSITAAEMERAVATRDEFAPYRWAAGLKRRLEPAERRLRRLHHESGRSAARMLL